MEGPPQSFHVRGHALAQCRWQQHRDALTRAQPQYQHSTTRPFESGGNTGRAVRCAVVCHVMADSPGSGGSRLCTYVFAIGSEIGDLKGGCAYSSFSFANASAVTL